MFAYLNVEVPGRRKGNRDRGSTVQEQQLQEQQPGKVSPLCVRLNSTQQHKTQPICMYWRAHMCLCLCLCCALMCALRLPGFAHASTVAVAVFVCECVSVHFHLSDCLLF